MAGTPTKQYASAGRGVCRTCNSNIIPKNHPLELFGSKAMQERKTVFLEKLCGVNFCFVYAGFATEKLRSFRSL